MINANELRTGNLADRLFWNPQPGHEANEKEICKVVSIQHLTVNIELKNSKTIISKYSLANLFPILLTPEILEKCGFEKSESNFMYYKNFGININGIMNSFSFRACVCNGEEFKYLHQIQNLYFALTGEELEINL